jgi:hypothetical protein
MTESLEEKLYKEMKDKIPSAEIIKAEWDDAVHTIPDGVYMTSNGYRGYKPKEELPTISSTKYDFKG